MKTKTKPTNGTDAPTKKIKTDKKNKAKEKITPKKNKKPKISAEAVKQTVEENDVVQKIVPDAKQSLKSVDTNILQYFNALTSDSEEAQLAAALQIVQNLDKIKESEKREKQLKYALKRLIRGCGAATNNSRIGFYTGLVSLLKHFTSNELPLTLIFDTLSKELHVGATITNKDDSYAVVGKILTCTALSHAGRVADADVEQLEKFANILLQSTHYRNYHSAMAYGVLTKIFEELPLEKFETVIWPLLMRELIKPWSKQTIHSINCLIAVHNKYPSIITTALLKQHFGGKELLNSESYKQIYRIYFEHTNSNVLTLPEFESFAIYIASSANLVEFWTQTVDVGLQTPTKILEIIALRTLTTILNNFDKTATKGGIVALLSPNFMRMFIEGLVKQAKQKKNDDPLQAFYNEFVDSIVNCCTTKLTDDDAAKVAVIRHLLLPPTGIFDIEKYTQTRVIHQLENVLLADGVKEIYELHKSIFMATLNKDDANSDAKWQKFERLNAGYTLQHLLAHKAVQQEHKWRREQLSFFFTCGIFHVNGEFAVCQSKNASNFSKEFGEQCFKIFYTSLQSGKMNELKREKKMLHKLVKKCNEQLTQHKDLSEYLRVKCFNAEAQQTWEQALKACELKDIEKNEDDDKLNLVFPILVQFIAIHLFREPEMAIPAIRDLTQCMENAKKQEQPAKEKNKSKKKKKEALTEAANAQPAWIEVVVDLLLQLLSLNASSLRSIVNVIFQRLSGNINLNAVHHILSMLDMKDGLNPLSGKNDVESDDEDETDSEADADAKEEDDDDEADDDDNNEGDEDEDDDDDDEEDDEDEEVITEHEKLRNAISQALMANGAAPSANDDDDMDSIDLNDITEEHGRKLDAAIAGAFKALNKSKSNGVENKKSKSYRAKATTVMHFRIRVLDLIEIYLQQQPTLLITIEIMLALYDMLQYCATTELKPLQIKLVKVLEKLLTLKNFKQEDGEELQQTQLVDFVRIIIEKSTPVQAYELINKLRNKCIVFLIQHARRINDANGPMLSMCQAYVEDFVKSRSSKFNITLLTEILRLRWTGVWQFGVSLAQQGILKQASSFRRIQAYNLLAVIYRNQGLLKLGSADETLKQLSQIEQPLREQLEQLALETSNDDATTKITSKEFICLIELILSAERTRSKLNSKEAARASVLCDKEACALVQKIRQRLHLDSTSAYQTFCTLFKLEAIRNDSALKLANGKNVKGKEQQQTAAVERNDGGDDDEKKTKQSADSVETKQAKKRKGGASDNSKSSSKQKKKQKKQQRLEAVSRGIQGSFFTNGHDKQSDDEA